ncbi:MAG: SPOR domain-containing protein [Gemmatimonadaceae bacterium]|nr:SPOR domain-containing protein [Gemmatimonadaceae bacterium]
MRFTPLALALVLAACGPADERGAPATQTTPSATAPRGPDNLMLRISRVGGEARVYGYPRLDTVVWRAVGVPAPQRVLAFDDEAGIITYVSAAGLAARVEFRLGSAGLVSKSRLTGLASADGSTTYGIAADGAVERSGPRGSWRWKPPMPARAVFPQADATLLVLGERRGESVVWRIRPPSTRIADSVVLPKVDHSLRTQVGDRLYLGSGSTLTGVRTRTMERTSTIDFDDSIELLAATPSGDRVFVVTQKDNAIQVVDRYRERRTGEIALPSRASDLRIDALGRYLLARPAGRDSALVIALGTNRVVGAVATSWRSDLPFVAPDGGIALAQGRDVVVMDGETLHRTANVVGGAADFWYPFRWTGFRPRDARLDRPVEFGGPRDSTARRADSAVRSDSTPRGTPVVAPRDTAAPSRATQFTVSFAALLQADKAHELASEIHAGNETARVVTATRDGATIYRVVLGPYSSREEAERVGREAHQSYWVYEGGP